MRLLAIPCALAACGRIGFATQSGQVGDAPPGDTAPADSGDAAPVCTALACDSFDTGIDTGVWTIDVYAGSTAPATTPVHSGAHSVALATLMITTPTTNPRAALERFSPLPLAAPTIYARAWFYIIAPFDTTATYAQLINFANTPGQGISIGARHGVVTANDYTSGGYAESATALPLGRWFCLQMAMPNGSTSTVRTFLDGTELTDIALVKAQPQPAPDHMYVGFEWVGTISSQAAAMAYLDDVAIGDAPIACN